MSSINMYLISHEILCVTKYISFCLGSNNTPSGMSGKKEEGTSGFKKRVAVWLGDIYKQLLSTM